MSWIVWLIIACAFGVGEMLTTGFFLAPFALGAGVAAVVDAVGAGDIAAWAAFVAVSLLTLVVARPIAISHMRVPPLLRTGSSALIGKQAVVLERVEGLDGAGRIKVDGEVWSARAFDSDSVFEPGARVEVVEIKGATALVME